MSRKKNIYDLKANIIYEPAIALILSSSWSHTFIWWKIENIDTHWQENLRTSSHNLEIERRWHTRHVTATDLCIGTVRNVVEDQEYLLLHCIKYTKAHPYLFFKIVIAFKDFQNLSSSDKFFSFQYPYILKLVGRFAYSCFQLFDLYYIFRTFT